MSARSNSHGELKRALKLAEARLSTGDRLTAAELEELSALASRSHESRVLPASLSRRVAHVVATNALRTRGTPDSVLSGFYEDVQSATLNERFSRARVSNAFLDAPQNLAVWRRTAAAACVLAAVAVGWAMSSDPEVTVRPPSQVERYSLLDGVLERFDPQGTSMLPAAGRSVDVHEVGGPYGRGARAAPQDVRSSWNSIQIFHGVPMKGRASDNVRRMFRLIAPAVPGCPPVEEVEKN